MSDVTCQHTTHEPRGVWLLTKYCHLGHVRIYGLYARGEGGPGGANLRTRLKAPEMRTARGHHRAAPRRVGGPAGRGAAAGARFVFSRQLAGDADGLGQPKGAYIVLDTYSTYLYT